jgi:hypothetical protein
MGRNIGRAARRGLRVSVGSWDLSTRFPIVGHANTRPSGFGERSLCIQLALADLHACRVACDCLYVCTFLQGGVGLPAKGGLQMNGRRIGKRCVLAHGPPHEAPRSGHRRLRASTPLPTIHAGPAGCGRKRSPTGSVAPAAKRIRRLPMGVVAEPIASGLPVPRRDAAAATLVPSGMAALPVPAGRETLLARGRRTMSPRGPYGVRHRYTETGLDNFHASLDKAGVALMDEIGSLWIDMGVPATKARRFEKHISDVVRVVCRVLRTCMARVRKHPPNLSGVRAGGESPRGRAGRDTHLLGNARPRIHKQRESRKASEPVIRADCHQ